MTDSDRPVAWVTGASRGMGADTARCFARAGYDVALTARDQSRLDAVASDLRAAGAEALPFPSDLTDRASVAAFADAALERFGRCDVVANIGIYQGDDSVQLVMDTALDALLVTYEADVVAPVLLCQLAIPSMLEHGGGTIVNMSSSSVFLEPIGTVKKNGWSFCYVSAKAGVDQLASILNVEHGHQGIRAFNVEPGFVAYGADFQEMLDKYPGRPVSPPECIGPALLWLVRSPDADRLMKKRVSLPDLTNKLGLLPAWDGPGSAFATAAE